MHSEIDSTIQIPKATCVLIHAWHIDMLDELLLVLQESGLAWRIVITTPHDNVGAIREQLSRRGMNAEIMTYKNRGRYILPFLHAANFLLDQGVEIVLKLHTKRSSHRGNGEQWRRELVDRLIRPFRAAKIIAAFSQRPELGIVGPEGHVLAIKDYLGGNSDDLRSLAARCGVADPTSDGKFVSGSMFWVRLTSLRPLLDAMIFESDFEEEAGQTDSTFAHAVERFFSACSRSAGYETVTAAAVCDEPEVWDSRYPYAARG